MIYLRLFISFLYIGLFTIGGGYAALPLIQEQTTVLNSWLTLREFSDLITISEITPGPIAINSATFVGMKVAGFGGAVCATLGFMIPPFVIVSLFYMLYNKYRSLAVVQGAMGALRPAVVALIASAGLSIAVAVLGGGPAETRGIDILALVLFISALVTMRVKKPNPIVVILICGALGLVSEVIPLILG